MKGKNHFAAAQALCLDCGLCCNGVIFADVKLQSTEERTRLAAEGIKVSGRSPRLQQPCAALEGCRCRIYASRPTYCRQFECGVFKKVAGGTMKASAARKLISEALRGAENIKLLLRALGDYDEGLNLRARFRQTTERLEKAKLVGREAESFGQLGLAVHELNLLLSQSFYLNQ